MTVHTIERLCHRIAERAQDAIIVAGRETTSRQLERALKERLVEVGATAGAGTSSAACLPRSCGAD